MKMWFLYLKNAVPALLLGLSVLTVSAAAIGCGDDDFEDAGEEIDEGIDEVEDELD